ncbi:hypothetical protein VNO77_30286 [Canavalia gladiata]|uniref:SHSP domain-containing protein n=1 Tax=Canavalia gladiata TaxID=3824 RepID=A0AAN9KRD7_CANGL
MVPPPITIKLPMEGHSDLYFTKTDLSTINPYDPLETFHTLIGGVNGRVDWKETHAEHIFKVDVPGLKKHEVKVDIEDGRVLRISGNMKRDDGNDTDKWHYAERGTGKFDRNFTLPENAKVQELKAAIEDGVLTVTVPKVKSDVRLDVVVEFFFTMGIRWNLGGMERYLAKLKKLLVELIEIKKLIRKGYYVKLCTAITVEVDDNNFGNLSFGPWLKEKLSGQHFSPKEYDIISKRDRSKDKKSSSTMDGIGMEVLAKNNYVGTWRFQVGGLAPLWRETIEFSLHVESDEMLWLSCGVKQRSKIGDLETFFKHHFDIQREQIIYIFNKNPYNHRSIKTSHTYYNTT